MTKRTLFVLLTVSILITVGAGCLATGGASWFAWACFVLGALALCIVRMAGRLRVLGLRLVALLAFGLGILGMWSIGLPLLAAAAFALAAADGAANQHLGIRPQAV